MQDEAKAVPRVYIVEQQPFDYSPSKVYGEPVLMDVQRLAPNLDSAGDRWNTQILQQFRTGFSEYVPELDFVILTGSPIKIMLAGAILKEKGPRHNILSWDARSQRYLHYVVLLQ